MAVAIIILFVISIFVVSMGILVFQPALIDLAYETEFWAETNVVDTNLRIMRDQVYTATIAIPIVSTGVLAIWAYLSVNRRDDL